MKFKNGPKVQRAIIRLECDELFEKNEIKLLQKKSLEIVTFNGFKRLHF